MVKWEELMQILLSEISEYSRKQEKKHGFTEI